MQILWTLGACWAHCLSGLSLISDPYVTDIPFPETPAFGHDIHSICLEKDSSVPFVFIPWQISYPSSRTCLSSSCIFTLVLSLPLNHPYWSGTETSNWASHKTEHFPQEMVSVSVLPLWEAGWICCFWNRVPISSDLPSIKKGPMFVLMQRSPQSLPRSSTPLHVLGRVLKSIEMAHMVCKKKTTKYGGLQGWQAPSHLKMRTSQEHYSQQAVSISKSLRASLVGDHLLILSWHSWGPSNATIWELEKIGVDGWAISLCPETDLHAGQTVAKALSISYVMMPFGEVCSSMESSKELGTRPCVYAPCIIFYIKLNLVTF